MYSAHGKFTIENLVASGGASDSLAIHAPNRTSLKYSELLDQMKYVRTFLNHEGVGRIHRVAVVLPNGPEMASTFMAVSAMSVCAPLNPSYKEKEFEFYLTDLNVRTVIVLEGIDSPVRKVAASMNVPILEITVDPKQPAGVFRFKGKTGSDSIPEEKSDPGDVALILHTSGTTARPKIVPLTQYNLCNSAKNIRETLNLSQRDICLNVMPLFHIHGLIAAVLSTLGSGGSVVCTPGFEASIFFSCVKQFNPTWYTAVPTIHQSVLASYADGNHKFRFVRSSSASLPSQVMADLEKALGVPVIEAYGMTEAAHQMASNPLPPKKRKPKSVGIAAGPEVGVMDTNGNMVEAGKTGEVVIRGPNVTEGYENNLEANKVAFAYGWFHTGDQGHLDEEGYLFLTGRIKEMINRAGEKISPLEVEEILLKHSSVAQAVAFAIPHPTLGEDVAAAVVLKKGMQSDETSLRNHVIGQLSEFKVPQRILIVDEIPKGPTGKLQRMKLAELFKAELSPGEKYSPPINETEKQLVEVWEEILKTNPIGRDQNYFALGGDSINLIKIHQRFQKLKLGLNLQDLFRFPTISGLAKFINERKDQINKGQSFLAMLKSQSRPPNIPVTEAQAGFYFIQKLNPKATKSNSVSLFEIRGDVNEKWLREVIEQNIKRHEIFRTVFKEVEDQIVQVIVPASDLHVDIGTTDLSQLTAENKKNELLKKAKDIGNIPFELQTLPLFRTHLFKLDLEHFAYLHVSHHIITDASSMRQFLNELAEMYKSLSLGTPIPVQEPEFQFADYSIWEKETITDERLRPQLEYWKKKLLKAPDLIHLPLDHQRPPVVGSNFNLETFNFSSDLWQKGKKLAETEGISSFQMNLTIFLIFLHCYSGDEDICVGSAIDLRYLRNFPGILGPLINNFIIRSQFSPDISFHEFSKQVGKTTNEAIANSDVFIGKIATLVSPKRSPSYSPLYQVMFDVSQKDATQDKKSLEFLPIEVASGFGNVDLMTRFTESDYGINVSFRYNADLFDSQTIERISKNFATLYEAVVSNPNKKIGQYSVSTGTPKS